MENETEIKPDEIKSEKEKVVEEVSKKSDEEILKEYLEENKQMITDWAHQLFAATKGHWFDIKDLMKKTKIKTPDEGFHYLNLLKLSGFLLSRVNETRKREEYSIVLTKEQRLEKLEKEKERLEKLLLIVNQEIEVIKK